MTLRLGKNPAETLTSPEEQAAMYAGPCAGMWGSREEKMRCETSGTVGKMLPLNLVILLLDGGGREGSQELRI